MRVRDSDQTTNLFYWIETEGTNGCNTASTRIWIRVPTIPASSDKTIYLYYGSPSASAGTNGSATFDFFDSFTTLDGSVWTSTNGASGYSLAGDTITIQSGAVYTNATVGTQPNMIAEAQATWINNDLSQSGLMIANRTDTDSSNNPSAASLAYFLRGSGASDHYGLAASGASASYDIASPANLLASMTTGTKYIIGTAITSTNVYFYRNRTELPGTESPHTPGWSGSFYLWLGYFRGSNSGATDISDLAVDWVLVRKFAQNPPTTSAGPESQAQVPDAPTGLTATPQDAQVSLSWTEPGDNGFPITDYQIEYRPGTSGSFSVFPDGLSTATSAIVTGLTNGQLYQFWVSAINSQGMGSASAIQSATPISTTPAPPIAQNVVISGTVATGETITGSYQYLDPNGDPESGITFRWMSSFSAGGPFTAIAGATAQSYTVSPSDEGRYLRFEVTPRSTSPPTDGLLVQSVSYGPVQPGYFHILLAGQSLSIGYDGAPALTTSQPYNNVKLNGTGTAFVSLIENDDVDDNLPATAVETPASALGNTVTALTGGNLGMVVTRNGIPGATYDQLRKGGTTTSFANGITQITNARTIAASGGFGYRFAGVAMIHGPANFADGLAYETFLNQWQQDYETDGNNAADQTGNVPFFIDQSSNFTAYNLATAPLVIAQLNVARNNPDIYMIGPRYQFTYASDNIYLTNSGYRRLREYYGKAISRVLNGQTTTALIPAEVVRNGDVVSVRFEVPESPLVFDTVQVLAQTHMGFEYADDGNTASISSVAMDGQDTVRITLDSTPSGSNQLLRYAYTGVSGARPGADSVDSARGNLRDSDSTTSLYSSALYNWSVHFNEPITEDTTPPGIFGSLYTPSDTTISATWNSTESGSSRLYYGVTLPSSVTSETNLYPRVTAHTASILGLLPCTTYVVRPSTTDLAHNIGQGAVAEITTTGCAGSSSALEVETDTILPSVGGTISLLDGTGRGISLAVPAGYFGSTAQFQIQRLDRAPPSAVPSVSRLDFRMLGLPSTT
ncbi:MAG: DUF2341 domain-containing protein [Patescibacteria group bacterium]|nr:DUF2341 domain-containing protein [Patescibacteria group bacterium]